MSKATEMLNLVEEYRNNNDQIIKEVYEEAIRRIRQAASSGRRQCNINTASIARVIPSNEDVPYRDRYVSIAVQECLWDKLRADGFSLHPDYDIEWSRIVRW